MSDDITIDLGMDPSTYLAGAQQISGANSAMQQSFGGLAVQSRFAQRALDAVTPKRAALLAWGGMSVAAAQTQQNLSGMAAQAAITHSNTDRLASGMRQLARDFPIGAQGAQAIVEQFTKMGVASQGSEARVLDLSKSVTKLSGATGEGPGILAQGMVDLARATGNTNLDPKRFSALGDSLTTVSAQSGASATNILSFSKSIAPMAQAAGIGATGVLGISSAFARMGEDGVGASTAVNKMLTDMSRSVREGTPEIATYAQIVGKTSDQFERLFKANPTEAITQVTEALAKSGDAPRQLEMLGLDGVRTARSLTALSASGGLRGAVAQASSGYDSGATEKASQAAFGGLNDALSELNASARQLSEAFGTPLLRPLTSFVNLLKLPTNIAGSVVGSGAGQGALTAAAYGGVGIMAVRALLGPLSALGLGRQVLTSGPVRSLAAGYVSGRGIQSGFLSRYAAPATRAVAEDRMGPGNRRFYDYTRGLGTALGQAAPRAAGPGLLQYARGTVGTLVGANFSMMRGQLINGARTDPFYRMPVSMGMSQGPFRGFGQEFKGIWDGRNAGTGFTLPPQSAGARFRDQVRWGNPLEARAKFGLGPDLSLANNPLAGRGTGLPGATRALESFSRRLAEAGEGAGFFRRMAMGALGVGAGMTAMGARTAASGAGMLAKGAGAVMGTLGGPVGLALMGGYGLYTAAQNSAQSNRDADSAFANRDISSTLNTYRDSIGKATGPAVTHASMLDNLAKNLSAGTRTMDQATTVSDEDKAAAATGKSTHNFVGTDAGSIAAQVRAISPTGMAPDELQAVKVDLLRQFKDPKLVGDVLKQAIPAMTPGSAPTGSGGTDYQAMLGKGFSEGQTDSGWSQFMTGTHLSSTKMSEYDDAQSLPGWMKPIGGMWSAGGMFHRNSLSDKQQEAISAGSDAMQQRYGAQSTTYGAPYAEQERLKGANSMLAAAAKTGNSDVYRQVIKQVTADLTGKEGGYEISSKELASAGGDVGKVLSGLDKNYARGYKDLQGQRKAAGGDIDPSEIQSAVSKNLSTISPLISKMFDARQGGAANQSVAASLAAPGDLSKLDKAASAMVTNAQQTGKTFAELGAEASKAANNLSEASQEFAIVKAAQAKTEMAMARSQVGMAPSDAMTQNYSYLATQATQDAKNPTQQAEKRAAQQSLVGMDQQNAQRMQARLTAQREYEVASVRAEQDAARSREYAVADFAKQVGRMEQDAGISRGRAQEDFAKTSARAEADYGTQRARQVRDFGISIQRTEADAYKSRSRALRDFNISVARQIEDAAKTMYDPYSRIQTKATWDAKNLLVNINEQNAAMVKQKAQLDQLRHRGLSAQAIDQLGLGKTENAQQVNNLTEDAATDPKVLAQLNAAARARAKDTGALFTDSSNTDLKRSKADLAKSLRDMEVDLKTSTSRARADLGKSMRDQAVDFAKSMSRSRTDFNLSLRRSEEDLSRNESRMQADQATSLARQREALRIGLSRMGEDIRRADEVISGSMADLAKAMGKAMAGQTGAYQGLITNDTKKFVSQMQSDVIPAMKRVAAQLGIDLPAAAGQTSPGGGTYMTGTTTVGGKRVNRGQMAEGGRVQGYSPHAKADNIEINATAGYFMQPVHAVKHYGVNAMEAIRAKKVPKDVLEGYASGGLIGFGKHLQTMGYAVSEHPKFGGVHPVHTKGSQHYNRQGPGGGGAIDVNADPFNSPFKNEKVAIDKIVGLAREYGLRTLWQIAGHFNHAHFDIGAGADMLGKGYRATSGPGGSPASGGSFDVATLMKGIDPKKGGWYGALREMITKALVNQYGDTGGASSAAYTGKGGAKQWEPVVKDVLHMLGRSNAELGAVLRRIDLESGGNPKAINLWDSNAKAGIPSKGLMQVIDPTFAHYRSKALSANIYDPKANIYAGANYAIKTYGSLAAIDPKVKPTGYDKGGWMPPGERATFNGTAKPEAVLTDAQWGGISKLSELAGTMLSADQGRALGASKCTHMTVHNNQSYTYDQRNDFSDANITVQSQDPDDMARKLQKRQTQQRIAQTRGVRRSQ